MKFASIFQVPEKNSICLGNISKPFDEDLMDLNSQKKK